MTNYCSSEKSCAEKVCESVGKILFSYERCFSASSDSCNASSAVHISNGSPSCKSKGCIAYYNNDGIQYVVYSNIRCIAKLQHLGNKSIFRIHLLMEPLTNYICVYVYIYNILIWFEGRNYTSPFHAANSARVCDSTTNDCKCSTTTAQCTGETICNTGGTCQGKYNQSYK